MVAHGGKILKIFAAWRFLLFPSLIIALVRVIKGAPGYAHDSLVGGAGVVLGMGHGAAMELVLLICVVVMGEGEHRKSPYYNG